MPDIECLAWPGLAWRAPPCRPAPGHAMPSPAMLLPYCAPCRSIPCRGPPCTMCRDVAPCHATLHQGNHGAIPCAATWRAASAAAGMAMIDRHVPHDRPTCALCALHARRSSSSASHPRSSCQLVSCSTHTAVDCITRHRCMFLVTASPCSTCSTWQPDGNHTAAPTNMPSMAGP